MPQRRAIASETERAVFHSEHSEESAFHVGQARFFIAVRMTNMLRTVECYNGDITPLLCGRGRFLRWKFRKPVD